jgi:hypothetical protein
VLVVAVGCSSGSDDGDSTSVQIDDQVVVDPDLVAAARERQGNDDELAEATAATDPAETAEPTASTADQPAEQVTPETTEPEAEPEIEVAEAEEDELDGLLNSLTMFNNCLAADGFEFAGAPGIEGATADQFEQDYLASLGKCATSSNILQAFENFGSAQESRTPEEIATFNFGLPVFRNCIIGRGWVVGELVPDEKGALGFDGTLQPPGDANDFATDDIADCRLEAEQYVAENYDPEA